MKNDTHSEYVAQSQKITDGMAIDFTMAETVVEKIGIVVKYQESSVYTNHPQNKET